MNNEIAIKEKSALSWNKSQMDLIKRTVASSSTDDEFNMFMYLAKTYQLDPMTKEIWFIKYKKDAVPIIMTSRDGYLAIANRNPHYQGLISDVVHENDEFEKLQEGVKHKYSCKDRGKIIGAYALGYRDDRKYPIYIFAHFEEYVKKNSSIWTQYSSAMILKVAEAMMFKRLFSISGLVTKEEIAIEKEDGTVTVADLPFDPQNKGQVAKKEWKEKIIDKALDKEEVDRNDEAIDEVVERVEEQIKEGATVAEQEQGIENDRDREQVEMEFEPASDKQIDFIYGTKDKKGIVDSHLITKTEVKHIGKQKDLSKEKACKILAWWWGDKDKNVIGEREKREKNPKTGESDLERRGELAREVLVLMKKNYIHKPMQKKYYKKYQKNDIKELTTEELVELKGELEHYVPDWK